MTNVIISAVFNRSIIMAGASLGVVVGGIFAVALDSIRGVSND